MQSTNKILMCLLTIWLLAACSGNHRPEFVKNPIDDLAKKYSNESDFSIILYDMDFDEGREAYKHQYQVVIAKSNPDTVEVATTDWLEVSDEYFNEQIDNMGMELISKQDGVMKKSVSPAGYSNYVGNEKYGRWVERDGGSFWEFYGKYAMFSSIFHMVASPVRYSYWNDYHTNYRSYGRPYYGPPMGSGRMYGTNSRYNQAARANSSWNNKPNSFKSRVQNRVRRSSSRTSSSRTSRRSNRYSSRSSSRSRSGGFGK